MKRLGLAATAILVMAFTLVSDATASPSADLTPEQIAARVRPSVVGITIRDKTGNPTKTGSGVVVGKNEVVTCWHVVDGAHEVTVNFLGGRSEESPGVINADFDHDLALIWVPTETIPIVPLGSVPALGSPLVAIGNPKQLSWTVSTGVVSGVRTLDLTRVVQTTAPISHGSSGGALLDSRARLIGIVESFRDDGQNLNFATVSGYVKLLFPAEDNGVTSWDDIEAARGSEPAQAQPDTPAPAPSSPELPTTPQVPVAPPSTPEAPSEPQSTSPEATPSEGPTQITGAENDLTRMWKKSGKGWRFSGDASGVQAAINAHEDINATGPYNLTPLVLAAVTGRTDIVKLLLAAGADTRFRDVDGHTALMAAAAKGHADTAELLLSAGADTETRANNGMTALLLAVAFGKTSTVVVLLNGRANVNARDSDGDTPIMLAAGLGHVKIARILLAAHAHVNASNNKGVTALDAAKENGHESIIRLLVKVGERK